MTNWILIDAAKSLFAAFDAIAPGRDHTSDGSIGDTAHVAEGNSDHLPDEDYPALRNKDADHIDEVHAVDVDSDLRTDGLTMEMVVQFILARCRSGAEKRLRYIIYFDRIWEASNGWAQRAYTGASKHEDHAHFSFSYDTPLEASTVSWHLEDIPVALTAADKTWIQQQIDQAATAAAQRVWATQFQRPGEAKGKTTSAGAYQSYTDVVTNTAADHVIATLGPKVDALAARLPNGQ